MTEYWKSNAMHWCDICKCWMNDTKAAKMNHERGATHQAKLAQKLRDMGRKAENEERARVSNVVAMEKIEAAAKKQFEADQKAAARETGSWVWDFDSSYYYNEKQRWYFDPESRWYYGGEPTPQWTQTPPIPSASLFGTAPHVGGPIAQGAVALGQKPGEPVPAAAAAAAGPSGSGAAGAAGAKAAAAAAELDGPVRTAVVKRAIALPKHPLAALGGHQAPATGKVGGGMGAGVFLESSDDAGAKRKREAGGKTAKGVSAEEAEALARREAAKQRVAARTAAGFGYL